MRGNDVTRPGTLVMITTVRPTPVARTRRSTSLGPIFGTGTVAGRSGARTCGRITARIVWGRAMALRYRGAAMMGAAPPRLGGDRFVSGSGRFVDDVRVPGMLHAAVLRSPHAHARLVSIDS